MRVFILSLILLFVSGCTDDSKYVTKIVEAEGFHDVNVLGYALFDCSEDDFRRTRFTAVSDSTGKEVSGTVCSRFLFKSSTIRYNE